MKKPECSFPAKHEDQTGALFSVLCTNATQKKLDAIVTENKAKQVVGIPVMVSQDPLGKEMPEEINIVFLRLFSHCLGFALTVKVIFDK